MKLRRLAGSEREAAIVAAEIRTDIYAFGDRWAFRADGFKDELDAQNAARTAVDAESEMRVSYSPSSENFYCWTLDSDGCAKRDDQGRGAPPDYETHWYSPRADFWCVWGCGFADEDDCDAAVDRARR